VKCKDVGRTGGHVQAVGHEGILYCVLNWNQVAKKNLCPLEKKEFVISSSFFPPFET
jgi:hypothetical protein